MRQIFARRPAIAVSFAVFAVALIAGAIAASIYIFGAGGRQHKSPSQR